MADKNSGFRLCAKALAVMGGLGFSCLANATIAGSSGVIDSQVGSLGDTQNKPEQQIKRGSFVVAPIPFSNPTIGSGLVLGAGYLFNIDPGSKPSVVGVAALKSDNGSEAYGFSINLNFDNNRWLFTSLFAKADIRYDLSTPAGSLPLRQEGVYGRLGLAYGVTPKLSFGGMLRYLDTDITPNVSGLPPIPPPYSNFTDVKIGTIGAFTDWDRRDDTIYPTNGSILHAEAYRGISLGGLVQDYSKAFATYAFYKSLGDTSVLAAQFSVCSASHHAPFFDQCSLGSTDDFRGFSVTQFIDARSASAQVEYRHRFTKRLGMVAFGGVGVVGPKFENVTSGGTLSAAGIGGRFRISKKYPLDFSVDLAHNSLSENLLYIYVGQRF